MKFRSVLAAGICMSALSSVALAQSKAVVQTPQTVDVHVIVPATTLTPAPAAAQPALVIAQSDKPVLRQGTTVRFSTEQALSSQKSKEGDRFELRTVEPVYVGAMLVIPAGTRAVGEVTRAEKRAFGKSGKLDARILFVVIGDQHIGMSGKVNQQGSSGTVRVVVAAALFWPAMPFITGKSAELPIGTNMTGFVENDLPLVAGPAVAAAPVAPLVVPAVAPVAAPAAAPVPAPAPIAAGVVPVSVPATAISPAPAASAAVVKTPG